jgi:regulator of protease activity HflC (stomatin/prohibitin superfamily)
MNSAYSVARQQQTNLSNIGKSQPTAHVQRDIEESSSCCVSTLCACSSYNPDDEATPDYIRSVGYWAFFALVVAIIVISTIASSFWYVSYSQYALRRNTYSGVDLTPTFTEGRYFQTLVNSMVYFPSTYQEVTFESKTFAENGLEFDCQITFYYRLPKDSVGSIYNKYSTSYDTRVVNNAKQVAKNVASTFSVDNFLSNRTYIERKIAIELEPYLLDTVGVYAPADYFKIINIVFPETLMSKSLETAVALQNNQVQSYQQEVDLIEADTQKLKATIDAQTSRTIEYAKNQATQIITNAHSKATQILLVARSDGIDTVCNELEINSSDSKNKLTKVFAVMDNLNNITMLSNVKGGTLLQI